MIKELNLSDELGLYEGADVEYKSARGGLPRDLWETYSAFANTDGGTIWLGITQRTDRLEMHGVPEAEKLLSDFWNTVNNPAKVSTNLLRERDVRIVRLNQPERALIRIDVPRADRSQRPVYLGADPRRGSYRRNYEGDFLCSPAEVRSMFADQSDEPADSRILEGFSLEDIHRDSLRQYRNRFISRGTHVWQSEDELGLLAKLGGWRRDRRSGAEGLTLAGLLMFGREQAIREPSALPGFQLDYRERFAEDSSIRWTDRLHLDGTWEGNLFQFYQLVMQKLSVGPGIKRPFQRDAEGYRSNATPVIEALQEALVNALIHADYLGQGGVVIDRWPDRLEFSNPGTLLVSREQLLKGGVSECRNKSLQLMFQMLGAGDKAGSGIDKIRSSWAAEHWQSPELRESYRPDRVVLALPMISLLPDRVLASLRQQFGPRFDGLSGDEVEALVTAELEGAVTNQRLQGMLTLHRFDITRMLGGLVEKGFLVSDGVGRGTRYRLPLPANALATAPSSPASLSATPVSVSATPVGDLDADLGPVYPEIVRKVQELQRARPEQMRQAILAVCAEGYLSAREIAELLRRSKKRVQDEFLHPMCEEGVLSMRYPDTPNHKQQAYRARPAEYHGDV